MIGSEVLVGKCIVLISSKGGCGKSTVATGLAAAFSGANKSVLLIDADEGARCLDTLLAADNKTVFDISDVINGTKSVEDVTLSVDSMNGVYVIPSPLKHDFLDFSSLAEIASKEVNNYDYVIIDTKGQLPAERLKELDLDALFISVVTTDAIAIKNTGLLNSELGKYGIKPRLIINRFKKTVANGNLVNIDDIIDSSKARLIGIVPEDSLIVKYSRKPIVFGKAAMALNRIASRLDGNDVKLPKVKDIL